MYDVVCEASAEALFEQSVVWRSDVKGLCVIIFWLDAVRRVVLIEVEHANYEKSRVRWAVSTQMDQFQPI